MPDFLAAILSATLGGVATEVFRIYLRPLLRARWPPGGATAPRLQGTWRYDHGTLEIRQYGTKITAKATRADGNNIRHFDYEGRLMGGQLVLSWKQSGGEGHIVGAMVLRIAEGGQRLEGMTTYLEHDQATVMSRPRKYTRA